MSFARSSTVTEVDVGVLPTLRELRNEIPDRCFQPDDSRAARYVVLVALGLLTTEAVSALVWVEDWWMLAPAAWLATGTVFTSLFMLTHDCGHNSLFTRRWLNQLVGHVASAPLLYPFTQWKLFHDAHHRRTNQAGHTFAEQLAGEMDLAQDTAFAPVEQSALDRTRARGPLPWAVYVVSRWFPPSIVALLPVLLVFLFPRGSDRQLARCRVSLLVVVAGGLGLGGGLYALTGSLFAIVHFWIAPLLVHAGWLGYYAYFQHTGAEIAVFSEEKWDRQAAPIMGTVNTRVPGWVNALHANAECHVVHHLFASMPSYFMREANDALTDSRFAHLIRTVPFSISHVIRTLRTCHVWDEDRQSYVSFGGRSS